MSVRSAFAQMTAYVALFADQIKYLSALNTSGQSVRNAIIQANKMQISDGTFDKATLMVSKGGLQKVTNEQANASAGKITITWDKPTATNFTKDAKLVAICVQESSGLVEVLEAEAKPAGSATVSGNIAFANGNVDVFVYFLDKRGSNKVASLSDYLTVEVTA